jgi:carbon-monoxide dehydrogenase large subunit
MVVAGALDQARDAAERVVVDYEPRPGVVSARDAFAPNAPQLYDECPNNEAYFYQAGDKTKVDAAFAAAARRRTAPDHQPGDRQSDRTARRHRGL